MPLLGEFQKVKSKGLRKSSQDNVRQLIRRWMTNELIKTYLYPPEWISSRLVNIDSRFGTLNDFFGLALLTEFGSPFLLVSLEKPNKSSVAEERLRLALQESSTAKMGISSDGTLEGTKFIALHINSKFDFISDIEQYKNLKRSNALPAYVAVNSNKPVSNGLLLEKILERLENFFFEAHSHIRDIDGLHSDEALDELCKLLYTKIFDENNTRPGNPYRFQRRIYGSIEECAGSIRELYNRANEYDSRVFSLKIPGYKRSRGVFDSPLKLSSAAIVKIVDIFGSYDITSSDLDIKGRAFQKMLLPALRAGMGQYFTPAQVVKLMVDVIEPKITDLILDPFSGSGHFLTQALEYVRQETKVRDQKSLSLFSFSNLHGIEKSERMVRIAMTDMLIHGDGHSNIRCTDALLNFANYSDLQPGSFDLVLTNPPFGSILGNEALSQLSSFKLAKNRKRVPLEVLGLERCVEFLCPGGKLAIVLPASIFLNTSNNYVRKWIRDSLKIRVIISLPVQTFTPFGANIKTNILFARKWKTGEDRNFRYNILLMNLENIGYDSAGRLTGGSDIGQTTYELKKFLKKDGW